MIKISKNSPKILNNHNYIQKIRKNYDLWDLFTRKEEYSPEKLDRYGRFLYTYSNNRDILSPLVSQYLINHEYRIEYPENKQFAACLTHDVDEIYPPYKHQLLSALTYLKRFDLKGIKRQISWRYDKSGKSPYVNFQEIINLEEKYNAKSSFYFLTTDSDIRRFRYNIEDLEGEIGQIVDRGCEVGLHGGYFAYNNIKEVIHEKERLESVLGKKVNGYRNHYLRFQTPDSWKILEKAGFGYDTTLGYADMIGFRNGMCHPFHPYYLQDDIEATILEIPMVIMDGTLFNMVNSYDEAWNIAKKLIDIVVSNNGVLTLNWHSNNYNCAFRTNWYKLYEKILIYLNKKDCWMTSGENIWRLFN